MKTHLQEIDKGLSCPRRRREQRRKVVPPLRDVPERGDGVPAVGHSFRLGSSFCGTGPRKGAPCRHLAVDGTAWPLYVAARPFVLAGTVRGKKFERLI